MRVLDDLEQAWQGWAELGESLTPAQWATPSRLPGWTVREVFAHHCIFPRILADVVAAPPPDRPADDTAVTFMRAANEPDGVAHTLADGVAVRAVDYGTAHSTEEMTAGFRELGPVAVQAARKAGLDHPVDYRGLAAMPLGEAARVWLMEAVVHYFDIARAIDLPVPGPMAGGPVESTVALLSELPDPVAFIEAATGRSAVAVLPVIR